MTLNEAKTILCSNLTIDHARAWKADPEKWMYVTDRLDAYDIDYTDFSVDGLVHYVEAHFDMLLGSEA